MRPQSKERLVPQDDGEEQAPEINASRRLGFHPTVSVRAVFAELAEATDKVTEQDHYGAGDVIETVERRVAELLGHEAAVLMPSGTMAQQIALRIWCDRAGNSRVAFHPTCHLERHEQGAYRELHGLSTTLLGSVERLFTLEDLEAMRASVAAVLFELPQREIGGHLPAWDDLVEMTSRAREQGAAVHMDGARLWETKPFYDREYAEIAGLFDSVYVSFYKILGGIAGAALAGPQDVIDEARVWQRRHGGNLVHMYPIALSAALGLDEHLPRIGEYYAKAVEIAELLAAIPDVTVSPDPPHTNMMHVFLRGETNDLLAAAARVAGEHDIELFSGVRVTEVPGVHRWELTVGAAACEISVDELRAVLAGFAAALAEPGS
jgi:threonine aldolase